MSERDGKTDVERLLESYNPEVLKFIIDNTAPDWDLSIEPQENGTVMLVARKQRRRGKR